MTKTFSTKSVRTQDFDNLAATTKSIMRLCAFAMVSNGVIDPSEKDLELHGVIIHVADDLHEGKVSKYH
jgi:hypothetical protein